MYQVLGYLTNQIQSSHVMTLMGKPGSAGEYEYLAAHQSSPGVDLKVYNPLKDHPLKDRQLVKVQGQPCPFIVNLYEGACCDQKAWK